MGKDQDDFSTIFVKGVKIANNKLQKNFEQPESEQVSVSWYIM